jgi:hypothetical protein
VPGIRAKRARHQANREVDAMWTRRTGLAAIAVAAATALSAAPAVAGERTPAPSDAKAYIIAPNHGETVQSPVTVRFGLEGMGVAPAGVEKAKTGHHHLLINTELTGDKLNAPLPSDDNHRHFGGGQTQTTLDLPPGEHTLQLVLGDWKHIPHDPPVTSKRITITVE